MNYNQDVEIFPVLAAMFPDDPGRVPLSPRTPGVNMAGFAIVDDAVCQAASRMEILLRYYTGAAWALRGRRDQCVVRKLGW